MAKYKLEKPSNIAVNLEMKRVDEKEFNKNLKTKPLDRKGSFFLNTASGNEYGFFVENNNVIGYVKGSDNLSRVDGFAIHQDYRGKGFGKMALEKLKVEAKRNGKNLVVCAFPSTYEFFQKCGLKITDHDAGEVWLADK